MQNDNIKNYPEAPEGFICLGKGREFNILEGDKHFLGGFFDSAKCVFNEDFQDGETVMLWGNDGDLIYYAPIDSEIAKLNKKTPETNTIMYPADTIEAYIEEQKNWIKDNDVKFGDKVVISKPAVLNKAWDRNVSWTDNMSKYIGMSVTVRELAYNGVYTNESGTYKFPYNALTKIKEEAPEELKVGGTAYYLNEKVNILGLQEKTAWIKRAKSVPLPGLPAHDLGDIVSRAMLTLNKKEIKVGETIKLDSSVSYGNKQTGKVLYIHENHALVLWDDKKVPELQKLSRLVVA